MSGTEAGGSQPHESIERASEEPAQGGSGGSGSGISSAGAYGTGPSIDGAEPELLLPAMAPARLRDRLGPARRVMFFGKSMSRTRCTGALVDSLRRHGVEVRWRNLVTWRRWFGTEIANRLARAEFRRFKPDVVFVFFRDLPVALADEFRRDARLVIWCEEALEVLDGSIVDYFALADLVCMSNPARFTWLRERGLDNMAFLMSGVAPRYHRPAPLQPCERDVAFIGGPGRRGQRATFLAEVARRFRTDVYGRHWERWGHLHDGLRVHGPVNNRRYANICATSRIVLGVNEVNDDLYYFSNRTFLTLACGAFHLTHYVPRLEDVFKDGEHLVWYRDEDEALAKIEEWLPRAEERARIAAGGHAEVMQHHQYFHRTARILHWLQSGLPKFDNDARLLGEGAALPEVSRPASPPR